METAIAGSRTRPDRTAALTQALRIQKLLYNDTLAASDPKVRAFLTRSWCDVNEEIRKLKMKPLPKSVDATKAKRRAAPGPQWTE